MCILNLLWVKLYNVWNLPPNVIYEEAAKMGRFQWQVFCQDNLQAWENIWFSFHIFLLYIKNICYCWRYNLICQAFPYLHELQNLHSNKENANKGKPEFVSVGNTVHCYLIYYLGAKKKIFSYSFNFVFIWDDE